MTELATIARPYAEAVYKLASEQGRLKEWSAMLEFVSTVGSDPNMRAVVDNPKIPLTEVEKLFLAVASDGLDDSGRNFIRLLLQNQRTEALPVIREEFEKLKAQAEGIVDAVIISAFPLSDEQFQTVVDRLDARYKSKVRAEVKVQPDLIGGIRIEVGDKVMDASIRGSLDAMAAALSR